MLLCTNNNMSANVHNQGKPNGDHVRLAVSVKGPMQAFELFMSQVSYVQNESI